MRFRSTVGRFLQRPLVLALLGTGGASAIARLSLFLIFVVGARQLDTRAYAGLLFVVGASQLLAQFAALGWSNLITRMSPRFSDDDAAIRRGFVIRSFQVPAIGTLLLVVSLLLVASLTYHDAVLSASLHFAALTTPLVTMCLIFRSYLVGFGRPLLGILQSETLPMGGTLLAMVVLKVGTLEGAVFCYAAAHLVAILLQWCVLRASMQKFLAHPATEGSAREWVLTSLLTMAGFGGKLLMDRTDTLLVAPLAGMIDLAQYGSMTRLSALLLFVPVILLPVYGPRVSAAFHAGDLSQLRRLIAAQLLIVAGTVAPLSTVLLIAPATILEFTFGATYTKFATLLPVVVVTQSIFALALPFSSMLLMTKGEAQYAFASIVGCFVTFGLGIPLLQSFGVAGIAFATLTGVAVTSAMYLHSALPLLRRPSAVA